MKFKYLGTAAAEAVPAPFCECEVCENARKKGGRNIRTRSQAIINDELLIDFNADTLWHTVNYNIKLCDVCACIITHNHSDHLYPEELFCRNPCAAHMKNEHPFVFYGTPLVIETIKHHYPDYNYQLDNNLLILNTITPFEPFTVCGYKVTALEADHSKEAIFYIIEKDGKAALYANDTGLFPENTKQYLKALDIRFDFVSLDCTNGLLEWDNRNHMGLSGNILMRDFLKENGKADDDTIFVVHHFSHNGLAGYDELVPIAKEKGFLVSFDGMEVEF